MASFAFELVSPERLLISEQADSVTASGVEGEFTVMAQHAPFITVLKPGFVRIKTAAGAEQSFYVRGGFAEVNPEGLTILADYAVPAKELDKAIYAREIEIAEAALGHTHSDEAKRRAQERLYWLRDLGPHIEVHHATFH
jgi:F-type H+-transporting ATPase subunit epsilon